jgi:transposase-like protein/IS1 family transposase
MNPINLRTINLKILHNFLGPHNENDLDFSRRVGLVKESMTCIICGSSMSLVSTTKSSSNQRWRCPRPCRKETSVLQYSFFEGSKLELGVVLEFIYRWAYEDCSFKTITHELNMAAESYVNWRSYLREVCALKLLQEDIMLGGEGIEVQIDESLFVRRKYNRGRLTRQQWIFGAIDCTTKEVLLVAVPNRNAETLIEIIRRHIRPGSVIISDEWRAYFTISNYHFIHLTVNHQEHFVNPVTGAHTQRVENMWMRAKRRNKRECGTRTELIDSYLIEFMWREKFGENIFENIIEHIKEFY